MKREVQISTEHVKRGLTLSMLYLVNKYIRMHCSPQQIARDLKLGQQEIKPSTSESTGGHALRSTEKQFNFKTDCFFCGEPATFGKSGKVMMFYQ